jgi:hypothetical protein
MNHSVVHSVKEIGKKKENHFESKGFPRYSWGLRSLTIFNCECQNGYFKPKTSYNRLYRTVFPRYLMFLVRE